MEWFVLLAPVPTAAVDVGVSGATIVATLVAAVTPMVLALRQRLRGTELTPDTPELRVIDGGRDLGRRAA